ncbi:DUF2169 family type VI secretion system accessory protein [Chondromyces crocatus]|uniref:DUF2169 domain-containing protein n=1 Tax=Chondromyces crocatus TaxID=52 RepID=A0A0K1EQL2_CHOCO|nr:DUF2169 domain-containing protein [Chondromyces crocatus]AKT42942.1 uncharacterized protein CMC5_071700 [Chondromyces crocatus]
MSPFLIPEPRLRSVTNQTPFALFQCDKMAPGRRFFDTVVLKGTFALAPGELELAEQQRPIALADEPWDLTNAERSSLKHAGEVLLTKPSTDVIVTGTARSPGGEPRKAWDCAVEVRRGGETTLVGRAQALGPRCWRHTGAKGWVLTEPEPTLEVPIRYELAYGGAYVLPPEEGAPAEPTWVVHRPNPSGTGFFDERALDTARAYPAPQWQLRAHPVTSPNGEVPLAGFGPVARPWASRLHHAGTYDEAWIKKTREEVAQGMPSDYAADFDPRFFQCAHPDLIAPSYLEGDEEIVLTGLMPGAEPFTFQLPAVRVLAALIDGQGSRPPWGLPLDTVHLDLDAGTVTLCWRLTLDQALGVRAALFIAGR